MTRPTGRPIRCRDNYWPTDERDQAKCLHMLVVSAKYIQKRYGGATYFCEEGDLVSEGWLTHVRYKSDADMKFMPLALRPKMAFAWRVHWQKLGFDRAKELPPDWLRSGVNRLVVSRGIGAVDVDDFLLCRCTPRERAMIEFRMDGYATDQIGEKLNCTGQTVYNTLARVAQRVRLAGGL